MGFDRPNTSAGRYPSYRCRFRPWLPRAPSTPPPPAPAPPPARQLHHRATVDPSPPAPSPPDCVRPGPASASACRALRMQTPVLVEPPEGAPHCLSCASLTPPGSTPTGLADGLGRGGLPALARFAPRTGSPAPRNRGLGVFPQHWTTHRRSQCDERRIRRCSRIIL